MTPCPDCRIENRGPRNPMEFAGTTVMDLHIVFCPLHAQAGAMREALKRITTVCSKPGMHDPFEDGWQWLYRCQDALAVSE